MVWQSEFELVVAINRELELMLGIEAKCCFELGPRYFLYVLCVV